MMACTSPLFTVRSRPLRICLPSTVTCKFLTSNIGTSCLPSDLQAEMRDDLGNQLLFPGFLVVGVDRTERTADHPRLPPSAVPQGLGPAQVGLQQLLQKCARCLLAGAPLGVVLAALGVEL